MPDSSKVVRWPATALAMRGIDEGDAEYLAGSGLPNFSQDGFPRFSSDPVLPRLAGIDCYVVGTFEEFNDQKVCVRRNEPGVWACAENDDPYLVNSSVKALSKFLRLKHKYLIDLDRFVPPRHQSSLVLVVREIMMELDSVAMRGSSDGYWGVAMDYAADTVAWFGD